MVVTPRMVATEQTRALVVDDESAVLATMRAFLEKGGHEVTACANGPDAMAALAGSAFDVMLSDIERPGISGLSCFVPFGSTIWTCP